MPNYCRVVGGLVIVAGLCQIAGAASPNEKGIRFFEERIRPVLVKRCYQCHSQEAENLKAELRLDTRTGLRQGGSRGRAIIPGKPQKSRLIKALRHQGPKMPPDGRLPEETIADFVAWVKMGAPDPRTGQSEKSADNSRTGKDFWAFQPPKKPTVPEVKQTDWSESDIDRFILAKLEGQGLQPVAEADRSTLIRRAYFALIGLPPQPDQVEAFLNDPSPNAFENLIDRLLASRHFGQRWGRHWLDVARYAESTGKESNFTFPKAWRYRDYVIASFNEDKPYDQFVREQVAGTLLPSETDREFTEQRIATTFLTLGPKGLKDRDEERFRMDLVDDQIDTTTRAFLGLTVSCARCHDHKFDPIPTEDYYSLAGIFLSSETCYGTPGKKNGYPTPLLPIGPEAVERHKALKKYEKQSKKYFKKIRGRREKLAGKQARLTVIDDPQAKLKLDEQDLRGKIVKRIKKRIKKFRPEVKQAGKKKKKQLRKQLQKDIQKLQEEIAKLKAEKKVHEKQGPPPAPQYAMGVREYDQKKRKKRIADARVRLGGDPHEKGQTVPRGVIKVVSTGRQPDIGPEESGRLHLANWLASQQNPLTARVMVNRVWHHLFGRGIVRTVDNFGKTGARPSHPKLLDYLAVEFMENNWSVKQLIRRIMLSRVYRLSAETNTTNQQSDPGNRLLWRKRPQRLEGEAIRDAILAVSGQLRLAPHPNGSLVAELGPGQIGKQVKQKPLERIQSNRRSVYLPMVRYYLPEMLKLFNMAAPNFVDGRREVTTVPSQALFLMNNEFLVEQSRHFARRLLEAEVKNEADRIGWAYRLAFGRRATKTERQVALSYIERAKRAFSEEKQDAGGIRLSAWASFCQAVFTSTEFRYVF